jgi:hypothetical protein
MIAKTSVQNIPFESTDRMRRKSFRVCLVCLINLSSKDKLSFLGGEKCLIPVNTILESTEVYCPIIVVTCSKARNEST